MSTVFYRKWRPTRFRDVVGQDHVTATLRRAVSSQRVSHAYLFTGPRGVGKTSTARILAKAVNSKLDEHGDPLADSPVAIAIDEGRYMDLIEIDAASNRGIDDIRALRDQVLLRPSTGNYKVFIIDEVHMLTDAAFNALLKTLEEPPPQVIMVLATTDIHRVPPTIISRCQRFDFRRLVVEDVVGRLVEICDAEEIECAPEVLELIADSAWGSLRDAENLLEQLSVSYGGGGAEITIEQARDLLGVGDEAAARELATALLKRNAKRALQVIGAEASRGAELKGLREGAIQAIRQALLTKHGVTNQFRNAGSEATLGDDALEATVEQMMHAITILGKNELYGDASSPLSLEIASLQAVADPQTAMASSTQPLAMPATPTARAQRPAPPSSTPVEPSPHTPATQPPEEVKWTQLLDAASSMAGQKVRRVLASVTPETPDNGTLILRPKYDSTANNLRDLFKDKQIRAQLKPAFEKIYGSGIRMQLGSVSSAPSAQIRTPSANEKTPTVAATPHQRQPETNPSAPVATQAPNAPKSVLSPELPEELAADSTIQMFRNHGARVLSVQYGMTDGD